MMPGAPPPFQMPPLQFMKGGPSLLDQINGVANAAPGAAAGLSNISRAFSGPGDVAPGSAVPGAVGPTSAGGPNGPQPLVAPGTVPQGPVAQQGVPLDAIRGMLAGVASGQPAAADGSGGAASPLLQALKGANPSSILDMLRAMSSQGQSVIPVGQPGSVALNGAGILPLNYGG